MRGRHARGNLYHRRVAATLLQQLQLLHLADSALPIGAASHSFGLETLVDEGTLAVGDLSSFFTDVLSESGRLEAVFCRAAHAAADREELRRWNDLLSACKAARESRDASLGMGRRMVALRGHDLEVHLPLAFGFLGRELDLSADVTAAAYLHQMLFGMVSACQRLMPLGQSQATELLWELKPKIVEVVESTAGMTPEEAFCFQPSVEIASMRHPRLATRLFIS